MIFEYPYVEFVKKIFINKYVGSRNIDLIKFDL